MFYKLGKKIFHFVNDALNFTQIILIFLSFATILYWLLQLSGVTFIQPVAPFFESIKTFTHLFYNRTVSIGDGPAIDFSFLVVTFLMLSIVWGLRFVIEFVQFAENKYDLFYNSFKKKSEKLFNIKLEQSYLAQEYKNNKFLILINFCAINLTKDSFYNKNVSAEAEEKQKVILTDFSQSFSEEIKCPKKILQNSLLLYFEDINEIDKTLICLENVVKILKHKYNAQQWQIDSIICIETYAEEKEIMSKVENLMTLLKLNLKGKITCLATFKQRYSLIKNPKYITEEQGIYKIDEGEEEVFCLKK